MLACSTQHVLFCSCLQLAILVLISAEKRTSSSGAHSQHLDVISQGDPDGVTGRRPAPKDTSLQVCGYNVTAHSMRFSTEHLLHRSPHHLERHFRPIWCSTLYLGWNIAENIYFAYPGTWKKRQLKGRNKWGRFHHSFSISYEKK